MQDLVHPIDLAVDRRDREAGGTGLDVVKEQLVLEGLGAKNASRHGEVILRIDHAATDLTVKPPGFEKAARSRKVRKRELVISSSESGVLKLPTGKLKPSASPLYST